MPLLRNLLKLGFEVAYLRPNYRLTSPRVFPRPLAPEQALALVDGWLTRPTVARLAPGDEHWRVMRDLLAESGNAGNLTTDADLAALAIEHGAELCSTDGDFARFRRLRWTIPLVEATEPPS